MEHTHVGIETALANFIHHLPTTWLLLDSCSTTNLISNKSWLHDIYDNSTSILVRYNAGTITLTHKGYFGSYPEPVWFNPHGIANIMSLDNVAKYFCITMDTEADNAMLLHKDDGLTMKFAPTGKKLYHHNLGTEDGGLWTFMIQFPPEMDENWVRYGLAKLGQISRLPNWQRMLFCAHTTQLLHSTGEGCWNNKDSYFIWFEFVCRNSGQIASRRSWKRSCLGLEYTSKCSWLALLWEPN